MSSATIHGIQPDAWIPGPDFTASRDDKGKWTGSQTFRCRKGDFHGYKIQSAFRRLNSCLVVYPDLGPAWAWLAIDTIESRDTPGGISEIAVKYIGTNMEFGADPDEKDITYALNVTSVEADILTHPKVKPLYHVKQYDTFKGLLDGRYKVDFEDPPTATTVKIKTYDNKPVRGIENGTQPRSMIWFKKIFQEGVRTWQPISLEWTKSATNIGGLTTAQLDKMGWIDNAPSGNPPTPVGRNWRMTGGTESRTDGTTSCTSSYSITWSCSPPGSVWDAVVYTKPEPADVADE